MEIRKRDNFYAVPLMGGILCVITLLTPNSLGSFSLNFIILSILVSSVILEEVCGIILIVFAAKLKRGKIQWIAKKLLVLSLLTFTTPIPLSILISIGLGYFRVFLVYGMTGGLITLIGVIFHWRMSDDDSIHGSLSQESIDDKSLKINQSPTSGTTICSNCGTHLKGGALKFCPECGNELPKTTI
ncbi:MAG: zinc ribbon domain-containing protein [Candidatus Hermodarchaeota archaeon]